MWGDSRSPAFGDITEHFHSFCQKYIDVEGKDKKKFKTLRKMWGESIKSIEDVSEVFVNFLLGKIKKLPWCDEFTTQNEITKIIELLLRLNKKNVFSINSQPPVSSCKSNDPIHGWGPKNGYVFQKCYIEFFISEENLKKLIEILNSNNYSDTIVYQAVNLKGGKLIK